MIQTTKEFLSEGGDNAWGHLKDLIASAVASSIAWIMLTIMTGPKIIREQKSRAVPVIPSPFLITTFKQRYRANRLRDLLDGYSTLVVVPREELDK